MESELVEYGLSQKEAKIYLECLKLGPSTAGRISSVTGMRRTTTYDVLEALKSKGLVSSFVRDKKHFFQAVDPSELIAFLQEKKEKLKEVVPRLQALRATATEKPRVALFEGVKGVTSMLENIYKEKEMFVYGSAEKAHEALKHLPESLAMRRAEEGIKAWVVFERSEFADFRIKDPKIRRVTEMRFNESMTNCPTCIWIAGNQVAIVALEKELIGVYIVNKQIADTQRLVFENLWKIARK